MMIKTFYILLSLILITSCNRPDEEPRFIRIDNIEVTEVRGTEALLTADAYFHNPNDMKINLRKVDVDVMVEGVKVGKINQSLKTKIPANAEFKVPLDATFNLGEIGLLNSIISILNGKQVKVHYSGHITVARFGFSSRVPVEFDDEVRL